MKKSDPSRLNAAKYATLSLIVRLVASQAAVFNLWFSRRCYERSRGEMIMMFTEKILQRKNAGSFPQKVKLDHTDDPNDFIQPRHYSLISKIFRPFRFFGLAVKTTSERRLQQEQLAPATLGKILNIMRHVFACICWMQRSLISNVAMTCMKSHRGTLHFFWCHMNIIRKHSVQGPGCLDLPRPSTLFFPFGKTRNGSPLNRYVWT